MLRDYVMTVFLMGNVWYTDIQHFLDADGYPAPDLPRPAERLMEYFGSIIEAVTGSNERKAAKNTGVRCHRRPEHRRCEGRILATIAETNAEAQVRNVMKAWTSLWSYFVSHA